MIQVIATAIDAKSHYTGRHCSRVPEPALCWLRLLPPPMPGPWPISTLTTLKNGENSGSEPGSMTAARSPPRVRD